jgi:hypothetical protein
MGDVFSKAVAVNSQQPAGRIVEVKPRFSAICQYFCIESSVCVVVIASVEIRITETSRPKARSLLRLE